MDYDRVVRQAAIVVDAVNATRGLQGRARIVRVGAPSNLNRAAPALTTIGDETVLDTDTDE